MNRCTLLFALTTVATLLPVHAGENGKSDLNVLHRPLSKVDALNIAIALSRRVGFQPSLAYWFVWRSNRQDA
jgi:hypothetical protein